MTTVVMRAPAGATGTVQGPAGLQYTIGADGSVTVDASLVPPLQRAGYTYFFTDSGNEYIQAPIAAELVSIVAAASPTSGTPMTIAAQPHWPRKLQVRGVYSGAVANLVVNIVGVNPQGASVTETVNVAAGSSTTFPTVNAYAKVTSVTPVGTTTNVTTIGVGVGNALALALPSGFQDLNVFKAIVDTSDDVVGTVDLVAGTITPTTAPNGTHNYGFWYQFSRATQ